MLVTVVLHKHHSAKIIGYSTPLRCCMATPESLKASSQDGAVEVRFSKEPLTSVPDALELGSVYIIPLAIEATVSIWEVTKCYSNTL